MKCAFANVEAITCNYYMKSSKFFLKRESYQTNTYPTNYRATVGDKGNAISNLTGCLFGNNMTIHPHYDKHGNTLRPVRQKT